MIRHGIPSKCATIRRDMAQRGRDTDGKRNTRLPPSVLQYTLNFRYNVNLPIREWETKGEPEV